MRKDCPGSPRSQLRGFDSWTTMNQTRRRRRNRTVERESTEVIGRKGIGKEKQVKTLNRDRLDRWRQDIVRSVDVYNEWFMRFAPPACRVPRSLPASSRRRGRPGLEAGFAKPNQSSPNGTPTAWAVRMKTF